MNPVKLSDTWKEGPPSQYLLWVDGVGGFLIALSLRLTMGRAGGETPPDIALRADVSRHHATIQRDGEGYFLEAIRPVTINGQAAEKAFLRSGDRVTLGKSCQIVFSRTVPVSATARLDLVSGHRFDHPILGTILMAETLLLGPGPMAHIVVEDLEKTMVLHRTREGLAVRYPGSLAIGGQKYQERGPLSPGAQVVTDAFSFTLEGIRNP